MQEKQKLRRKMRELLAQMSAAQIFSASANILTALNNRADWKQLRRIFAFVPLPEEPQILDALLSSHKAIAVPRIAGKGLEFCELSEHSQLVAKKLAGGRGRTMWEPPAELPAITPSTEDLILVPGLAFTPCGARLGRGGGFYDRFLQTFPGAKWGVCFPCQILPHIPLEAHDVKVDKCFY